MSDPTTPDPHEIPLAPDPPPPPPSAFPASPPGVRYAAPPPSASALAGLPYAGPAPTPDAKTMGMLAHVLNFTLLGPLLIYLLKKDEHPFIADQSREALNFSLCCLIAHVACVFLHILCIGVLLTLGVFVAQVVLGIIGGLKARDGFAYRYPLTFRFIT